MRSFIILNVLVISIVSSHGLTRVDEILKKLKLYRLENLPRYQDAKFEAKSFKNIQNLILRLHRSMSFFENNFDSINVDGLYGLRIAEGFFQLLKAQYILKYRTKFLIIGSLLELRNTLKSQSKLTSDLITKTITDENLVDILYDRLSTLNKRVYESVRKYSPSYANNFDLLISKPFKSVNSQDNKNKLIFLQLAENSKDLTASFDEPFSDSCYSLLMKNNNNSNENCMTQDECFDFFTDSKASGNFILILNSI
jgi:hypothetical protein